MSREAAGDDADEGDDAERIAHPGPDDRFVVRPGCRRCPALAESRTCVSWGNGPRDASVVVVGEAPGAGDPDAPVWKGGNHTGHAYTSRHSGRRVRRLMAAVDCDDAYYTNAVKCFPEADDGGNREPTDAELDNCRTHLETELDTVEPEVVVATGKHATTTLLAFEGRDLNGFLDAVCKPIDCPRLGATLLPILHPSYQEVWLSRLDLSEGEYRERIARHLP